MNRDEVIAHIKNLIVGRKRYDRRKYINLMSDLLGTNRAEAEKIFEEEIEEKKKMLTIERKIESTCTASEKSERCTISQAAINSSGMLTIRNVGADPDDDEIIVFNNEETAAVFRLFRKLADLNRQPLPF